MSGGNSLKRHDLARRAFDPIADDKRDLVELADLLLDDAVYKPRRAEPATGRGPVRPDAEEHDRRRDIGAMIETCERRLADADRTAQAERRHETAASRAAIAPDAQADLHSLKHGDDITALVARAKAREEEARQFLERESEAWERLQAETTAREAEAKAEAERVAKETEDMLAAARAEEEKTRRMAEREAAARAEALRQAEEREQAAKEAMERAIAARDKARADAAEREETARALLAREQAAREERLREAAARRAEAQAAMERERRAREEAIAEAERHRQAVAARMREERTSDDNGDAMNPTPGDHITAEAGISGRTDDYDDRFQRIFDQLESQIADMSSGAQARSFIIADEGMKATEEPVEEEERPAIRLRDAVASIAVRQRDLDTKTARAGSGLDDDPARLGRALEHLAETAASIGAMPEPSEPLPHLPAGLLAEIRHEIKSLSERFERHEQASAEPAGSQAVLSAIEELAGRLETSVAQGGTEAEATIQQTVDMVLKRLEENVAPARAYSNLERGLEDVMQQIRDGQHLAADAIDTAASKAVARAMAALDARPNPQLEAIEQKLADFMQDAIGTERRTLDALDAVRESLQHVANRLPTLDDHVPAAAAAQSEVSTNAIEAVNRARAAARRAAEESAAETESAERPNFGLRREMPAATANETPPARKVAELAPANPMSDRARFIAAARRSMEEAAPAVHAPDTEAAELIDFRARTTERLNNAVSAASRTNPARRRQAYMGIAAALLLAGSFGVVNQVLKQQSPPTETAGLESPDNAALDHAPTSAELGVPSTYRPTVEDKVAAQVESDSTDLAAVPGQDPASADDIVTGSIPDQAVPSPLPAEIGPARLRTRALNGDAAAQYEIGVRFSEGRNVATDGDKAVEWLMRAAEQDLAPAQYRLGSLYEKGTGVARDVATAKAWYEKAAASGNVKAMHNLGVIHAEGGLGAPDYKLAAEWFEKAAEHDVADSQYNLGVIHTRGFAGKADFVSAYHWFSQAAKHGDKDAAEKRDQIAGQLDAKSLAAAKDRVQKWTPQSESASANTVPVPEGGWDQAATAETRAVQAQWTTMR